MDENLESPFLGENLESLPAALENESAGLADHVKSSDDEAALSRSIAEADMSDVSTPPCRRRRFPN